MNILSGGSVGTSSSWSGVEQAIGSGVQTGIGAIQSGVQGVVSDVGSFASSVL